MRATQLIEQLQALVAEHGDFEQVVVFDDCEYRHVHIAAMNRGRWLELSADWDKPAPT